MNLQRNDYPIIVDFDKCTGCGTCIVYCPMDALKVVDGKITLNRDACGICGGCPTVCPSKAIEIRNIPLPPN